MAVEWNISLFEYDLIDFSNKWLKSINELYALEFGAMVNYFCRKKGLLEIDKWLEKVNQHPKIDKWDNDKIIQFKKDLIKFAEKWFDNNTKLEFELFVNDYFSRKGFIN